MSHVLLISSDQVDDQMAGSGIRYWEMASALCAHGLQVTLAVPNRTSLTSDRFAIQTHGFDRRKTSDLVEKCDVLVVQGYGLFYLPFLKEAQKPLVADLYTPIVFENLENNLSLPLSERHRVNRRDIAVLKEQLMAGDFFTCASVRQRDFWLGMLVAANRVNPLTYRQDRSLRDLIDVVPFALSGTPPQHRKQVLKGVWPGIGPKDQVLLWGGGVWEWFDPLTLIRAVHLAAQAHPEVKLFFMGRGHPSAELNDALPMTVYHQAIQLSKELQVLNRHVFFNEGWVPYQDRADYLLEADIGVSAHLDYVESLFSFRTRLLDYIWAGLPMVVSGGDALSEETVRPHGLGRVVPPRDVEALVRAIVELIETPNLREVCRPRFERIRETLTWEKAVEPLAAFCRHPEKAADRR